MVGYPIGRIKEEEEDAFIVEVNYEFIHLSDKETKEWEAIFFYSDEETKKTYTELNKKGVCILAGNEFSLLSRLANFKPIRQGSSVKFDGNMILLIADKKAPVDEVAFHIWRLSNGQRTVKDIYRTVKKMGILNSAQSLEHHFLERMAMLTSGNILFLS